MMDFGLRASGFALIVFAAIACTDTRAPIKGTQGLHVDLISPTNTGSLDPNDRLAKTALTVTMKITAYDADGNVDTSFNNQLQVYVQFLGTLSPYFGGTPLTTVNMSSGVGMLNNFTLPSVFGPTEVWFDDGNDAKPTYATGVSPTLWYPDPSIYDMMAWPYPPNTPMQAFTDAPLEGKNVGVNVSRHGANGALVITSVYSQGYTLADVQCAGPNATPPCDFAPATGCPDPSGCWDSIDVFSYSAPQDQSKRFLDEGQIIDGFAGGVSNFDGLIEVGFPQTFVSGLPKVCTGCEPKPIKLDASGNVATDWFTNPIIFRYHQSALIEIDGPFVCPLTGEYTTYKQWDLDPSGTGAMCGTARVVSIVSNTTTNIDPTTLVGKKLTKVLGILRPISVFQLVYPRNDNDIVP